MASGPVGGIRRAPWTLAEDPLGRALARIRRDHRHGASALARAALAALDTAARRWRTLSADTFAARLRAVVGPWAAAQPAMGFFARTSSELSELARAPGDVGSRTRRWIAAERARAPRERARLLRVAVPRIAPGATVLTLSRSSAVREVLIARARRPGPPRVTVLRSRPGGEGRDLALELAAAGVRARVVPDRPLPAPASSFTLVLLGADAICAGGDLIHKVGTRPVVAWARRHQVPVVVLAESGKVVPGCRGPARLPAGFDRTPGAWIEAYWTDAGVRRPGWVPTRPPRARSGGRDPRDYVARGSLRSP